MNTYVDLSKVGSGKLHKIDSNLTDFDLKDRAINKLDAKLYFTKLEHNDIVKKINTYNGSRAYDLDMLQVQYNAIKRELQVLQYIYQKIL